MLLVSLGASEPRNYTGECVDEADQTCEECDQEASLGGRSLSASPRAFFDLAALDALSSQLHPLVADGAKVASPCSVLDSRDGFKRDPFMAIHQEDQLSRLQRRRIRAAIADLAVPSMSPVFGVIAGKRAERDESDQDMADVTQGAPSTKARYSAAGDRLPECDGHIEEAMDER